MNSQQNASTTTIKFDPDVAIDEFGEDGKNFPWVLTLNAGTEDEFTMCFRSLEHAAEAAKSWHGRK